MSRVFVTGATGTVGAEVVRLLAEYQARPGAEMIHVRAAVRRPERATRTLPRNVEPVAFDFTRPETYGPALRGVDRMFLVRPPAISNVRRYVNPVVDAARAAGVGHVVFLSLLGAEKNPVVPHRRIEDHLRASGLPHTLLRPGFFMQNLSTVHREDIRERDEIFVPAGRGRTSFIDARDVAAVAAKVLGEDGHEGAAYALTGGEALDYGQVAEVFGEVLGRRIVYPNPSVLRFAGRMLRRGLSPAFVLVMVGIYTTARLGLAATITDDAARLLERPPATVRQFARDYQAAWA